ncbi:hypothetical protein HM1_0101 [Heliomicrobium modesticaldum Ice1]|uniref:Uncharacterized protein n=1 Tax=Heliobacterium modesticaldum (strain ATCC 51547 / Ice1) TaxID=498761 RepID=B0TD28_HELMI|nr:hypothetical protein HM1_0101 [Heliomicrobium modesticaldum Ice1]
MRASGKRSELVLDPPMIAKGAAGIDAEESMAITSIGI